MSGKLPDLKIRVGSDASGVGPGFDKTKKGLSNLDKQMSDMGKRAKSFGLAVSAGIAAAAAAGTAMAVSAGRAATEISNLARGQHHAREVPEMGGCGAIGRGRAGQAFRYSQGHHR